MTTNQTTLKAELKLKTQLSAIQINSLRILALSSQELEEELSKNLSDNPFLEIEFKRNEYSPLNYSPYENYSNTQKPGGEEYKAEPASVESFQSHLEKLWLSQSLKDDKQKKELGLYLIHSLNESGFYTDDPQEAAKLFDVPADFVQEILKEIQQLDPKGFGARNTKECLVIQAKERKLDQVKKVIQLILFHLEDIAQGNFLKIAKCQNIDKDTVIKLIQEIKTLSPYPVISSSSDLPGNDLPDFYIKNNESKSGFSVTSIEPCFSYSIRLNKAYIASVKNLSTAFNKAASDAEKLIAALDLRAKTIEKVIAFICLKQSEFFLNGIASLKPLLMSEAAAAIGCHESTISRACSKKYISTRWGIHELNFFFSHAIDTYKKLKSPQEHTSVHFLKSKILSMIEEECKEAPLRDEEIAQKLLDSGFHISRRTISKYRNGLGIYACKTRRKDDNAQTTKQRPN